MFCAMSGAPTRQPVLSPVSNFIYDKILIEKYIDSHHTDPINNKPLTKEQLITINNPITDSRNTVSALSNSSTLNINYSIPNMLSTLQNEWDAVMLENFQLRKSLRDINKRFSRVLYEKDAAKLVASKLLKDLKAYENDSKGNSPPSTGIHSDPEKQRIHAIRSLLKDQETDQNVVDQSVQFMNETKNLVKRQSKISQSYKFKDLKACHAIHTTDLPYKITTNIVSNYSFTGTEKANESSSNTESDLSFMNPILKNIYWRTGGFFNILEDREDTPLQWLKQLVLFPYFANSELYHYDSSSGYILQFDSENLKLHFHILTKFAEISGNLTFDASTIGAETELIKILKHDLVNKMTYTLVSSDGKIFQFSLISGEIRLFKDLEETFTDAILHKDGLLLALYNNDTTKTHSHISIVNLGDQGEPITIIDDIDPMKVEFAMNGYWVFVQDKSNNFTVLDLRKQPVKKTAIGLDIDDLTTDPHKLLWDINDVGTCLVVFHDSVFYIYQYDKSSKDWTQVNSLEPTPYYDRNHDNTVCFGGNDAENLYNLQIVQCHASGIHCLVQVDHDLYYVRMAPNQT